MTAGSITLYHTNTRHHPGDTIRVRVDVRPVD